MRKLTPSRIRKIRKTLGMSKPEFGEVLWASPATVDQWESGECAPVSMHHRLLILLEKGLANPPMRFTLMDVRARDPMFLLYRLLEPLYGSRSDKSACDENAPQD
jgi:transcriptional regulator with XRE-family HTH domain